MKILVKYFPLLKFRYKLYAFLLCLLLLLTFATYALKLQKKVSKKIHYCNDAATNQNIWLKQQESICLNFNKALEKLNHSVKINGAPLMEIVEKCASDLGCKYELSNENFSKLNDALITSISVNFIGITLQNFIEFDELINTDGIRIAEINMSVNKDGTLNVKCLIESISLNERENEII